LRIQELPENVVKVVDVVEEWRLSYRANMKVVGAYPEGVDTVTT
jgi:hypothetical protein